MMPGCGYCVKTIRKRPYLCASHYESRSGGREQVEEYIGPARDSKAREEVARRLSAYVERARSDVVRILDTTRAEMAARGRSTANGVIVIQR